MAQKTNPNLLRLGVTSTWSGSWSVSKKYLAPTFVKYLKAIHLTRSFYQTRGLFVTQYYIEQLGTDKTVFHINLKEAEVLDDFTKTVGFYPRYSSTLPKTVPAQKRASLSAYADFCSKRESIDSTYVTASIEDESYEELNSRIRETICEERQILLPLLKVLSGSDFMLVKSSPSYSENFKPTAEFIAISVREQLLNALKRGKNVTAMRYFRNVGLFLQSTLGQDTVRGVRFQIKGRLPKSGGSSGAARSKHQLVSIGYLSNQKITSPLDYSTVAFRTRSGLCSIKIWASYQSPIQVNSNGEIATKNFLGVRDDVNYGFSPNAQSTSPGCYWS